MNINKNAQTLRGSVKEALEKLAMICKKIYIFLNYCLKCYSNFCLFTGLCDKKGTEEKIEERRRKEEFRRNFQKITALKNHNKI